MASLGTIPSYILGFRLDHLPNCVAIYYFQNEKSLIKYIQNRNTERTQQWMKFYKAI